MAGMHVPGTICASVFVVAEAANPFRLCHVWGAGATKVKKKEHLLYAVGSKHSWWDSPRSCLHICYCACNCINSIIFILSILLKYFFIFSKIFIWRWRIKVSSFLYSLTLCHKKIESVLWLSWYLGVLRKDVSCILSHRMVFSFPTVITPVM